MSRFHSSLSNLLAAIALVLPLSLGGCSDDPTTVAQFTPSGTVRTPGLVKLEQKSRSGSRVVVDVLLYGPEPALDLFAFQFAIKNANPNLVRFVPRSTYTQNALVAGAGQTIAIDVDGTSDPSLIEVNVEKEGGGAGNGFASASVVVIELTFDLQGSGATTLSLIGLGADPPQAVDAARAPIPDVIFDEASAGVSGVTTGGSGY